MSALSETCGYPFCVFRLFGFIPIPFVSVTIPLRPGIKIAIGFGSSLRLPSGNGYFPGADNNNGFPYVIFNGGGDSISFETDPSGQIFGEGTYDRMEPTKYYTVVENLDHFSISDRITANRTDDWSTLPREEQVDVVAQLVLFMLDELLDGDSEEQYCANLQMFADEAGYNVTRCFEDYAA